MFVKIGDDIKFKSFLSTLRAEIITLVQGKTHKKTGNKF